MYRQPFSGYWPITQNYGETITSAFHTGIDYGCPEGTPVLASESGIIRFSGQDSTGYGVCVIIEHDADHSTLYAHLKSVLYYVTGIKVEKGQIIGYSGNTGNSTGPHLHFEARTVWNNYKTHFNPIQLPMQSVIDPVSEIPAGLKEFSDLDPAVMIACSAGAYAHNKDFTEKHVLGMGTKLNLTGNTVKRGGLTFCECELPKVWIAVHNGEVQILDNY